MIVSEIVVSEKSNLIIFLLCNGYNRNFNTYELIRKCRFMKMSANFGITCSICIFAGEKPYKCTIPNCNKAFAQLSNLQHHQRNHDNSKAKSSRKSFYCTVCQRGFVTESSLDKHISRVSHHTNWTGPHFQGVSFRIMIKHMRKFHFSYLNISHIDRTHSEGHIAY